MAENLEENASLVVSAVNEATATLQDIQKGFEDFEKSAGSLGVTSVALGGILKDITMKAFEELKDMVKLGIDEAIEAEQIQVKLANSFKAEGAAAAGSVASINAMSDSLGALVGVDNDVIAATATTLRQLGGLSAEMINKAMPAIADLSIRTGSLESAAMTVTRAMNGQTRQLKMLGIEFEATGDKGADLEVLLGKVNEKFGGDAQAMMKTTGGELANLKVVYTDLAQVIGEAIIKSNAFKLSLTLLKDIAAQLKEFINTADKLKELDKSSERFQNMMDIMVKTGKTFSEVEKAFDSYDKIGKESNKTINESLEKNKLTIEQEKVIADFRSKNAMAKMSAIMDYQAAAANADAEAREQRGNELIQQSELIQNTEIITNLKKNMAEADLEQAAALAAYLAEEERQAMVLSEISQLAAGIANSMASALGQSMYNIVTNTNSSMDKLKEIWHSFGNFVLRMLMEMIAKVILFNTLTAIAGMGTGGLFSFAGKMASGLFSGQTPEGSTRVIPGPPNIAVPIMGHGGETIGRPESGGSGGLQVVVQGDYYESEEANERLFDRLYKYQKRTGVSLGV
jgi:hypothetical protein